MKRNIQWHKQCLANSERSLEYKKAELKRKIDEMAVLVPKWEADHELRRHQISKAESEGITEFDADKYAIKRPRKPNTSRVED